ncbi:MAG: hypothetical protein RLZZ488_778 [Pseudomonadota bacterium]|jgi:hypothetical protein
MIPEKNTSPEILKTGTTLPAGERNSTSVGSANGSSGRFLFGSPTLQTSPIRRTPAGLILLKSTPLARCAPLFGRLSHSLNLKPYAHTLDLLRRHQNTLRRRERDPQLQLSIAWLSLSGGSVEFNRRALESFELSLTHTLFLETEQAQQSVEALCAETHFDAIVAEVQVTAVILKRAQRWLKPAAHDPLKPESANLLETHPRERLFILIDEAAGGGAKK